MTLLADLKFGVRMLLKSPAFTLAAVTAMGLGIGVNSMMFTIYNAALFKSLPFERPEEVVHIHTRNVPENWDGRGFVYEDFLEYRQRATFFRSLATFMGNSYRLADAQGLVEEIQGCLVTAELFSLLGQRPVMGRDFQVADMEPGAPPVVILSYGLWQSTFGADPAILGKQVRLSSLSRTIVGVMPPGMQFPIKARLWIPIVDTPQNRELWYVRFGYMVGRLKDPARLDGAQAELRGIGRQLAAGRPRQHQGIEPVVLPYGEWDVQPKHRVMAVTAMGAVTFVLLIACTNVANLLLSRAVQRSKEVAIRMALGATRLRIGSQLLTESMLLSFAGGVFGLGLAFVLVRLFVLSIQPLGVPYWIDWSMDVTSLLYLGVICVASGVLFGIAPALQISGVNVSAGLQAAGRQGGDDARGRKLSSGLVVAEISLTLVLMVAAGLMIRSSLAMQTMDLGIKTRDLLTMLVPLDGTRYPENSQRMAFADRLEESLRSHPDVQSFTVASGIPASGASLTDMTVEGREMSDGEPARAAVTKIGEGYFEAVGLRMVRGREFTRGDSTPGIASAIVNQRLASQYWPGEDPLGKRIRLGNGPWRFVVGVSPAIRQTSLRREIDPLAYVPFREGPPYSFSVLVRTRSANESVARTLRDEMRRLDPDLPAADIRTMDETIERLSLETRILGLLFSVFAAIGLLLSALGIYAVTAHATSRRTREIGIRIALGATRADIARLVLRSGARQLAIALPIGLGVAFAVSQVFESVLFEVTPLDPVTFFAIPTVLSVIVFFACLIPARKASRLSPVDALRTE